MISDTLYALEKDRIDRWLAFRISIRMSLPKKFIIALMNALPDDARLERIQEDFSDGWWQMFISSQSFEKVPLSQMVPRVQADIKTNENGEISITRFHIDDKPFEMPKGE